MGNHCQRQSAAQKEGERKKENEREQQRAVIRLIIRDLWILPRGSVGGAAETGVTWKASDMLQIAEKCVDDAGKADCSQ